MNLIGTRFTEKLVNGYLQYERVMTYQFFASNTSQEEFTVLSQPGLPQIGSPLLFGTVLMYCTARVPRRQNDESGRLKWLIDCVFTNDTNSYEPSGQEGSYGAPAEEPTEVATRVDISFQETWGPPKKAVLNGVRLLVDGLTIPLGQSDLPPDIKLGYDYGRIINSAADEIQSVEVRRYTEVVTLRKYFSDYDNDWGTSIGKANSGSVTFTQKDKNGTRFSRSFAAKTLLLVDVSKVDVWRQGVLYFDVQFTMIVNADTWVHTELDRGTRGALFAGQYKWDGTSYTQAQIDDLDTLYEPFADIINSADGTPTQSRVAVAEPVPMNGYGHELMRQRPGYATRYNNRYYLDYDIIDYVDFGTIGIST